jgi:hypothetical protein
MDIEYYLEGVLPGAGTIHVHLLISLITLPFRGGDAALTLRTCNQEGINIPPGTISGKDHFGDYFIPELTSSLMGITV